MKVLEMLENAALDHPNKIVLERKVRQYFKNFAAVILQEPQEIVTNRLTAGETTIILNKLTNEDLYS